MFDGDTFMESASIQSFMSKDVLSVSPDTPLNKISTLMRDHNYSCLPVTENNKPIGIITERDVLEAAVTPVDPALIGAAVVGHVEVLPAVGVEVGRDDTERGAVLPRDPGTGH